MTGLGGLGDSLSSPQNSPGRTRVFAKHVYGRYPETFLRTPGRRAWAVACSFTENCLGWFYPLENWRTRDAESADPVR
jgi:hypothetical protein